MGARKSKGRWTRREERREETPARLPLPQPGIYHEGSIRAQLSPSPGGQSNTMLCQIPGPGQQPWASWDVRGQSGAFCAHLMRDPSAAPHGGDQSCCPSDPSTIRSLSVEEALCMQGFPLSAPKPEETPERSPWQLVLPYTVPSHPGCSLFAGDLHTRGLSSLRSVPSVQPWGFGLGKYSHSGVYRHSWICLCCHDNSEGCPCSLSYPILCSFYSLITSLSLSQFSPHHHS